MLGCTVESWGGLSLKLSLGVCSLMYLYAHEVYALCNFPLSYEASRAEAGWVDPADCPVDQPGLLRDDYLPGDLKFDPLGLKPEDDEEFAIMQTKELQHGRLGMLAAAGFLAQEAVDGQGIIEHLQSMSA